MAVMAIQETHWYVGTKISHAAECASRVRLPVKSSIHRPGSLETKFLGRILGCISLSRNMSFHPFMRVTLCKSLFCQLYEETSSPNWEDILGVHHVCSTGDTFFCNSLTCTMPTSLNIWSPSLSHGRCKRAIRKVTSGRRGGGGHWCIWG